MNEEKQYLTTKELAERWEFSEITLATWRHRNKGPKYHKKGYRNVVYKMEDIIQFENDHPGFAL